MTDMTTITLDYPKIRAGEICPLCELDKPVDTLVCWHCYNLHRMRYGTSPLVKQILEETETRYDKT